ncbi:hypothetical protein [uncultured Ruegeria sp.]|uniref:hypothetical protein n=1 Tax=uncultured Ruegeria sp. TaxID=259304 RepID=UPI00262246F1|nr:hypothetical protein [uncultured Ruegeria sp.]
MPTDATFDLELRRQLLPGNPLTGRANVLTYSVTDAAGAARNFLKSVPDGLEPSPLRMGIGSRAHIVPPGTPHGLLNIAALAGPDMSTYGQSKSLTDPYSLGPGVWDIEKRRARGPPLHLFYPDNQSITLDASDVIVMLNRPETMSGHAT